jgi:hypothetical protein
LGRELHEERFDAAQFDEMRALFADAGYNAHPSRVF